MEESQQPIQDNKPSYWNSVFIAGLLFGIVLFIISIISSYLIINSEPTGSFFSPSSLLWCFSCLLGALGGLLGTWHYGREYDIAISIGRGALIGFLTGVVMVLLNIILSQIWTLIDPDMNQKMVDSLVRNFEAMEGIPDEQKQQMIDSAANSANQGIFSQLIQSIPLFGILNCITGMIGAKLFGKKEDVI